MGVDQVSKHDHSTDADGGDTISPREVDVADVVTIGPDSPLSLTDGTGGVSMKYSPQSSNYIIVKDIGKDNAEFFYRLDSREFVIQRPLSLGANIDLQGSDIQNVRAIDTDDSAISNSFTDPDGTKYTGIVGTLAAAGYSSGDYIPLENVIFVKNKTTSDTTFTQLGNGNVSRTSWGLDGYPFDTFAISVEGRIANDTTGETTTVRGFIQNTSETTNEVTVTGNNNNNVSSYPPVEIAANSGNTSIKAEAEVTGGQGKVWVLEGSLWGKVP